MIYIIKFVFIKLIHLLIIFIYNINKKNIVLLFYLLIKCTKILFYIINYFNSIYCIIFLLIILRYLISIKIDVNVVILPSIFPDDKKIRC
jgi:hypothetical protein